MPSVLIESPGAASALAEFLAPLGRLISTGIERPDVVNQGRAARHSFGGLAHAPDLVHAIALFEVRPRRLPFRVELLEVHPKSDQLIMPVSGVDSWIVAVAPDQAGGPDLGRLRVARLEQGQGIVYRRNVWHMPIFFEGDRSGLFLVQSMKDGRSDDCIEREFGIASVDLLAP